MLVFASQDSTTLDQWRAAFDDGTALVEVRTSEALPACLAQMRPKVVVLDARLSRIGCAHAVDQLLAVRPETRVIAVGDDCGEEQELALFLAGVRGYCPLDAAPALLRAAVEAVQRGELWIRRALVPKLIDCLTSRDDDNLAGATGRFAILTPREIEIAQLIGKGASNKRIARQLAITERTVKSHLTMIFRKTGADDRVKLALFVSRRH